MKEIMQCVWAFLGALAFGVFFNVHGKNLFYAALGGFVGWAAYILMGFLSPVEVVRYFWAGAAISLYSELFAVYRKCPVTVFLGASMIPMVPGGTIYYTMEALLKGDTRHSIELGVKTFEIAGAIAMGIIAVAFAVNLVKTIKKRRRSPQAV